MEGQNGNEQLYIKALKERDPVKCQEIYNRFLPKVIAMIRAKGGSVEEAKDVFHQAILAILFRLESGDIVLTTSFWAYLKAACYNKFIDLCRDNNKKLRNEKDLRLIDVTNKESKEIEELLKREKQFKLLWQCFEMLSDECKKIIKGKLDGLSPQKIMEQINYTKPVNAFYQKRFDCMRRLKLLIEQHLDSKFNMN